MQLPSKQRRRFSGTDTVWLRNDEATNPMVVNALMRFDGVVDVQTIRDIVARKLLRIPRFRSRATDGGHPRWCPASHFTLSAHLLHHTIDEDGHGSLHRLVECLANQPLDWQRPLWELHLIDQPGLPSAMLARVHHSLADGFALLGLMLRLIDDPEGLRLPGAGQSRGSEDRVPDPVAAVRQLPRLGRSALGLLSMPVDPPTVLQRRLGGIKRLAWCEPIPLRVVKDAKARIDGTINDALVAALCVALRRYLASRGQDEPDLEVTVTVPVNLLPMRARGEELGNGFGLVYLRLPLGLTDPDTLLAELKRRMDVLKGGADPFVSMQLMRLMGNGPRRIQRAVVDRLFRGRSSAVVTNVPGPLDPVSIGGHRIDDLVFWVPQSASIGVGISFFTYADRLRVGVTADAQLVPDPAVLATELERALLSVDHWSSP